MGLLARFWRWLTSSRGMASRVYGDPRDTKIDIDGLARDLDIARHAKELGEKCLPSSISAVLSGTESQLLLEVRNARAGYAAWAAQRVSALNEQINACDVASITNRALQVADEFSRNASALVANWRSELSRLSQNFQAVNREFEAFKAHHKLERSANYPTPARVFLLKALLVSVVVVEGLINAAFFGKGLWGGLLQGFIVAISFSVINVLIAYAWGRYLTRYVHHVSMGLKVVAAISLIVYASLLVAIALWIGHYRDALGNLASNPSTVAWDSFFIAPLALRDLQSMILSALTIAFGVFAITDAYNLDDPYPGYGAMHRRWLRASDELEEQKSGLRAELQSLGHRAEAEVDRLQETARSALKGLDNANQQKEITEHVYAQSLADTSAAAAALIGKFRDENQKWRPDTCRDVVFAPIPPLDSPTIDFDIAAGRTRYAVQQEQIAKLTNEVEMIRARIQSSFHQQLDSGVPLDTLVANDGNRANARAG